jgi:hypothetical protein
MLRAPRHGRLTASAVVSILTGALLLLPTAASAHPFLTDGGRVPVQSLATITLDLAHGCGDEQSGAGLDTDEVALEAPDWLRVVDIPQPDGWRVTTEQGAAAGTLTIVWSATTGAEPAPRFTLDVVVDGQEGETRFLRVSQRCGDRIERWIGTPDAPAEQPGIRLRLTAADPNSPPPLTVTPPPAPEPVPTPAPAPAPAPGVPMDTAPSPGGTDVAGAETTGTGTGTRPVGIVAAGAAAAIAIAGLAPLVRRRTLGRGRRTVGEQDAR